MLLLAACAAPRERAAWEDPAPVTRELRRLDPGAPPGSDLRWGGGAPPQATDYPPPPGGRLLASAAGPAISIGAGALALPPALWLPAAPARLARAIEAEEVDPDFWIDATLDADVDGDGAPELVVLGRPAALFEVEAPDRVALLLAFSRTGDVLRLLAAYGFAPRRHEGHACHGEWRLAGTLRRGRSDWPLVWEERGVACGLREGGGFDRALYAVDLAGGAAAEVLLARARLGAGGAADLHEAAAWAADVDGDGAEELVVRGVSTGARPCGAADPAFWVEELAFRVALPGRPVLALRGGAVLELQDGVLPPQLLASHPAPCGTLRLAAPAGQGPPEGP